MTADSNRPSGGPDTAGSVTAGRDTTDSVVAGHVAILGAGPIGLDAALACSAAGWSFTLYEAGDSVAAHVRAWQHARMFTPWSLNVSPRMRDRLQGAGHHVPDGDAVPSGAELITDLLDPLAALPEIRTHLNLQAQVTAIARQGLLKHEQIGTDTRAARPFRLLIDTPDGETAASAELVLDCTGTYGVANTIGEGGIPAPGERHTRIVHTLPDTNDPERWSGVVVLVGAGKSAQTAARDLGALPHTQVEWIVRAEDPDWGQVENDSLPGRHQLVTTSQALTRGDNPQVTVRTGTYVASLDDHADRVRVGLTNAFGSVEYVEADHVIGLTGYTGDASIYRQLQVHECYATAAPIALSAVLLGSQSNDCLAQPAVGFDVLRNPEPHFYILGSKSYGRLNTFLLRSGYEQVSDLIAAYTRPLAPSADPLRTTVEGAS